MYRFFIIGLFCLLIFIISDKNFVLSNSTTDTVSTTTITTEGCDIPGFSLISEEIKNIVDSPEITRNCSTTIPLVGSNSSHIWVNKDEYDLYNIWSEEFFYCCYKNFSAEHNFTNLSYGRCVEFKTYIKVEHAFVRVECYYSDSMVYDDFILNMKHFMKNIQKHGVSSPNVIILGMDGMSRMNFLRTMPKTSKYLRDKGSIQLLGYNKVGDNTYPNIFPLLIGRSFKEVIKVCKRNNLIDTEKCPFMWDRYKAAGYTTALGSDSNGGLFDAYERGLAKSPTDFYLQPFMYETRHLFKAEEYHYHICLQNKFFYKILLNHIKDLAIKFRFGKLFGFFWEETITHEYLNLPHIMDKDYADLLSRLENSVVIFLSDHGKRLGKITLTEQGRVESRLPLLEAIFPIQFRRRYKLAYKNFENNRHRLTTPYDVYETLLDLIDPTSLQDHKIKERTRALNMNVSRMSLFLPIPGNRTCETVGIDAHSCACRKGKRVPARYKVKVFAARYLVAHINELLSKHPQCHVLEIDKIFDATVTKNTNGHGRTYTVVVQTSPGAGIFEGTLVWYRGLWVVIGTVSRLNLYRDQSRCVADVDAKMYCFCK